MAEAKYQLSEKISDSAILVVRGDTYTEFSNNIDLVTQDDTFRPDLERFLNVANGKKISLEQAQANVQQGFPNAEVQQQGPPPQQAAPQQQFQQPAPWDAQQPQQYPVPTVQQQQQWSPQASADPGASLCPHGQREFKSGVSKSTGKPWKGWFCAARVDECKPQFIR